MAKKKYVNIYFMFLLVVVFVTFLGLFSNCYAITITELDTYVSMYQDLLEENNLSYDYESRYIARRSMFANFIEDYDYIVCKWTPNNNAYIYLFTANTQDFWYNSNTNTLNLINIDTNNARYCDLYLNTNNSNYNNSINLTFRGTDTQFSPLNTFLSNCPIYTNSNLNVLYTGTNYEYVESLIPPNTITLISQNGTKFTFYDKDQLQVTFTGEWTPADFTFYVERYIDNEWQQFSDSNDYYELYGYENPYYIFWRNLNYYPAGIYRYSALLGNNPEQAYYSNSFQIYDTVIENNVTGTVDSNGDIDINIDTGKTVDSIKDFLGEEPITTEKDIEDSFPQVEVEDPTHNFFAWVFEQIEDIFTTTEDRTFTFSLYTGNSYTIHSNDITVPNSPLKTLVGLSVDFGICYYILRDIHKTIEKVKKGSFEQIAEEDITANMV